MSVKLRIEEILEDISDARDAEIHRILRLDGHDDPRQAVLRWAKDGKIPAHPWNGKVIFFKSELRRHMAANAEAK